VSDFENKTQDKRKKGLFGRMFGGKSAPHDESAAGKEGTFDEKTEQALQELSTSDQAVSTTMPSVPGSEVELSGSDVVQEGGGEGKEKRGWFGRLKDGLTKSSSRLSDGITGIFSKRKLDEDTLQELEDILIQADLGVDTAMRITDRLAQTRLDKNISTSEVQEVMAQEVEAVLMPVARPLETASGTKPFVILMAGVNGAGKTTTIGKLSRKYADEGKKVMLAAGDTFRAAAVEQLDIWGQRTGAPVVKRELGSDAASLAFEAMTEAKEADVDILMMDTAGRLQNKAHLMDELKKIVRVMKKLDESAPHAVLLVLDATTGQNALNQVKVFGEQVDVTGLVMTKLDGSARGGILVAIAERFKLPVHFIGVGEGVEDLQPFRAEDFARAIAQI
jgi:fused signal recognition particle receptor